MKQILQKITGLVKSGNLTLLSLLITATMSINGCDRIKEWHRSGGGNAAIDKSSQELLYQTATLELSLANSGKPYLVIDVPRKALEIRLKGAILLTVPLKLLEAEKGDLDKFVASFGGHGSLLRPLQGKYLFQAFDQTPDSVLAIVSGVVNVKAELLQREIPERFRLFWNDNLNLDVVSQKDTVADAKPKAKPKETIQEALQGKLENMKMEARYVLRKPFGVRLIVIEASPEDALTLYRVASIGAPTLLQLVSTEPLPPPQKVKKKK